MIPILMMEDDKNLNHIACSYLESSGSEAAGCLNTEEAYEEMYRRWYKLTTFDIMMPGTDGLEFAKDARGVNEIIPILFMSARNDLLSKQREFQLGINDCMVRPTELDELLLHVRTLLRWANIEIERHTTAGNLELNAGAMTVFINGGEIPATTREFHILYKPLSYPGRTLSRTQLMDEFWGVDTDSSLWVVDVYIAKLRDKFL